MFLHNWIFYFIIAESLSKFQYFLHRHDPNDSCVRGSRIILCSSVLFIPDETQADKKNKEKKKFYTPKI